MFRLTAALLAGATVVGAQAPLPRFERTDCPFPSTGPLRTLEAECGRLIVPESRTIRGDRTIALAVVIAHAREPNSSPPLVMIHGGPGGGGIRPFLPAVASGLFGPHREVIVYDQRAAGLSRPKLCVEYEVMADSARNLRDADARAGVRARARRACLDSLAARHVDLHAYNTRSSAQDLVDLRHALGYARWDVFGESYGGRLAQELVRLDSGAIRSVVLASPDSRGPETQAEEPLATQHAIEHVFVACFAQASCRAAFPDLEPSFYSLFDELSRRPIPVTTNPGSVDTIMLDGLRLVTEVRNRFLNAPRAVARLPLLINQLASGDRPRAAREIVGEPSAPSGNTDRVLRQITVCYDVFGADLRRAVDSVNALVRAPFKTPQDDECTGWLDRFADASERAPVATGIPTLILTGYFDHAVQADQARRLASRFSHAYAFDFPTEGHAARPDGCHRSILVQFLDDPARPPDASCIASIEAIPFALTW